MRIKQREVPIRFRRIAADHLESIRESNLGPNTKDLYIGDTVCQIFRPDFEDVAYFEFQVIKATRENVDNRIDLVHNVKKFNVFDNSGFNPIYSTPNGYLDHLKDRQTIFRSADIQGFIIVSTDVHDFPIPHWSLEKLPPSLVIEQDALSNKKKVEKIYKIDSLTYLGEDEDMNEISHIGEMPALLNGLPEDLEKSDKGVSTSYTVSRDVKDRFLDDSYRKSAGRTVKRGPRPLDITFTNGSWKKVKNEFNKSFKPLLNDLRKNSSEVWKIQSQLEEMGEGIISGDVFNLVPLEKEYTFDLKGKAVDYVKVRVVKRAGGHSVVEIATYKLPTDQEYPLTVTFNYGRDYQERVELFVVNINTPSEIKNNNHKEEE